MQFLRVSSACAGSVGTFSMQTRIDKAEHYCERTIIGREFFFGKCGEGICEHAVEQVGGNDCGGGNMHAVGTGRI